MSLPVNLKIAGPLLVALWLFCLPMAAKAADLAEINQARTYGQLENILKSENSTNLFNAVMNVMAARHPFNYGEDYKRAVAGHFATITNYNAGPRTSLLFRGMESLGVFFGPKKMFELPPDELVKELENLPEWRETYPPFWAKAMFTIDSIPLGDRHYDIVRGGEGPSKKVVLLLHGGGMILPMSPQHWTLADYLAKATGRDFYIPDYPMLPHVAMYDITTSCFETYKAMLQDYAPEDIVFMGDSAGCSLCLTVCYRCTMEKVPLPKRLILVSPAHVDTDEENLKAEMEILAKEDGIIPLRLLDTLKVIMPAGAQATHNECDPFHGQMGVFPPMDIFTGSREIFAPQAIRFFELAKGRGVKATLTIGQRCIHDWILIPWAQESVTTRDRIADIIKGE